MIRPKVTKETLDAARIGDRFERRRKTWGFFAGPLLFVVILLIPMPSLSPEAHRLGAILCWTMVFWVTEAIPIPATALFASVLCTVLQVASPRQVFAPFANPVIFLFLGSFVIAQAMSRHQLDRRFALYILSVPRVGSSPRRILMALGGITFLGSMWLSNTAMTAMMLPIVLGILRGVKQAFSKLAGKESTKNGNQLSSGALLLVAYMASVGGLGTPVGSPTNLVGLGMISEILNIHIGFFQWMLLTIPLSLIMFGSVFLLILRLHPPEMNQVPGIKEFVQEERRKLGVWSRGQRNSLAAFGTAVGLWLFPGIASLVLPPQSEIVKTLDRSFPEAAVGLLAACLLFFLPVNWKRREFTLDWQTASDIDWGTILLFGGGLSLGTLMNSTRLAHHLGDFVVAWSGAESVWALTAVAILAGIVASEATSNTATANIIVPIVIAVAQTAGVNPLPPALGATLASSYAFMLPISTPPNAIMYGTGLVPITRMIHAGVYCNLFGAVILWVGLRLLYPLLGFGP